MGDIVRWNKLYHEKHGTFLLRKGDTIELSSLGLHFPVADVYLNTSFLEEGNG